LWGDGHVRVGRRLLVVATLVLGTVLGTGASALAHNALTGSDPEDGASLEQGPDQVRLEFRASLDPHNANLDVTGPDGSSAVDGEPVFDGGEVTIPVRATLAGEYEVAYEVLSADGDWADGTLGFTVTVGEQPSPTATPHRTATSSPEPAATAVAVAAADEQDEPGGGIAWWVWLLAAAGLAAVAGYTGYRVRARRRTP
jgi:hypothetical protein